MQAYAAMKNSGVAWLGDIPADWKVERVKWVFNRQQTKNKSDDPVVLSLARAGVKIRDISTNEGQLAESYLNYNTVKPGDVLLNPMDLISGANCSVSRVSGVISPAYMNLHPKTGDSRYFDYYFKLQYWSNAFFVHGRGVSYDNRWTLNTETIMNYPVLTPDDETQQRIADYLDEETALIDGLIAKQQHLLELLEEKRRATITNAVTDDSWPREKIKYIATKRDQKVEAIKDVPYIGLEHVESFSGKRIEADAQSEPEGLTLGYKAGDVLFGKLRPYLAKVLLTNDSGVCSSEFIVLNTTDKLLPEFLKYSLLNEQFIELINSSTYGAKMPRANWDFIGNATLALPSIDEQKQIVDRIEQQEQLTDQLKQRILNQIDLLKERRTSLISSAVTGKIKV